MSPKQFVLKHIPMAEAAQDGFYAGKFFDFAIFENERAGSRIVGQGASYKSAWKAAENHIRVHTALAAQGRS